MLENSAAVVAAKSPGSAPKDVRKRRQGRAHTTNDPKFLPRQPLSLRAIDRRRKDLVGAFLAALGPSGVNDLTQVMVRRAAELTVAAEVVRAGMLTGNLQSSTRRCALIASLASSAMKPTVGATPPRKRMPGSTRPLKTSFAATLNCARLMPRLRSRAGMLNRHSPAEAVLHRLCSARRSDVRAGPPIRFRKVL